MSKKNSVTIKKKKQDDTSTKKTKKHRTILKGQEQDINSSDFSEINNSNLSDDDDDVLDKSDSDNNINIEKELEKEKYQKENTNNRMNEVKENKTTQVKEKEVKKKVKENPRKKTKYNEDHTNDNLSIETLKSTKNIESRFANAITRSENDQSQLMLNYIVNNQILSTQLASHSQTLAKLAKRLNKMEKSIIDLQSIIGKQEKKKNYS